VFVLPKDLDYQKRFTATSHKTVEKQESMKEGIFYFFQCAQYLIRVGLR